MIKPRKLPAHMSRLVLARNNDEAILIGDDIRIILIKAVDGHAKIVIEAPRTTTIIREEIKDV